jgi:hypothetical protein
MKDAQAVLAGALPPPLHPIGPWAHWAIDVAIWLYTMYK